MNYLQISFGIFLGIIVFWAASKLSDKWPAIASKASLIKKYWYFVVPFSILVVGAYCLAFIFVPENRLGDILELINNLSTLIFGIFVGYFAFLQVIEGRVDKLKEL